MCVWVYTSVHINIHAYIYIHIICVLVYTYACAYISLYLYVHVSTSISISVCRYISMCSHTLTHTQTHTHVQQNTHKPTKRIAAPCDIYRHTCPYSNTTRKAVHSTLDQRRFNEAALAARASLWLADHIETRQKHQTAALKYQKAMLGARKHTVLLTCISCSLQKRQYK